MTLPPDRIGDKGWRFEVRYRRADDDAASFRVLGWAKKPGVAREMFLTWLKAPDVAAVWIVDRVAGKVV